MAVDLPGEHLPCRPQAASRKDPVQLLQSRSDRCPAPSLWVCISHVSQRLSVASLVPMMHEKSESLQSIDPVTETGQAGGLPQNLCCNAPDLRMGRRVKNVNE